MLQRLRQQPIRWLTLLASLEVVALVLSVKCALHLRYLGDAASLADNAPTLWPRALLFALTLLAGMGALGLYQPHLRESWFGLFARQLVGFLLGIVGLLILYFAFPDIAIGRGVFGLSLIHI